MSKSAGRTLSREILTLTAAAAALIPLSFALGHGTEARYVEIADWQKPNFGLIFATDRSHLNERSRSGGASAKNMLQMREIGGQTCVIANIVAFDVDDGYAYDIDEPVTFRLTYVPQLTSSFVVAWDQSGGTGRAQTDDVVPQPDPTDPELTFETLTVEMDRARFAGQGVQGSDIAIASRNGIALCDVSVERSRTTLPQSPSGTLELTVKDAETGALVPARLGLYDETGRAPLASDDALMMQRFADDLRMLEVNDRTFWPSENRQAFYVDGTYRSELPAGRYELIATRGLEYRALRDTVEIEPGQTTALTIELTRYTNMPEKGWYSGDSHIHLTRDDVAAPDIWAMVAAEDVHVGNLLEMGNIAGTHFKQPKEWGKASRFERDGHFIVSGQEDPRTWFFGHTIHHNLEQPIHAPPSEYFLYDKVFEESHRQGGISGFAHMGWGDRGRSKPMLDRALAMLAPFGVVDFIEVLQGGRVTHDGWYTLLNLGFKVSPAAGSDWPYTDFPGVVRNYVKLDGPLNLDRWFESFRSGHVYVTNGPLLEFTVNGRQMGDTLEVARGAVLDVGAAAALNPDVDRLDRLELIVLGEVEETRVASGDAVELETRLTADRSMWIVVRAYGSRQEARDTVIAHSAPIYVVVEGEPTWKREAVPGIIADARAQLEQILVEPIDGTNDLEYWETRELLAEQWQLQRPLMKPRVAAADALYQQMLDRLEDVSTAQPQ